MNRLFALYKAATAAIVAADEPISSSSSSSSSSSDTPTVEPLSPDYTGNLLLNITTGDGTVLKTLTLIYDGNTGGTVNGVTHWETAGDDLGTCYCGTGCCNAVYLQYRYYNNTWFTECYVEDEGGCWDWTGIQLILGKNLVTSIETGKPQSVVITKA